jgi:hypothetical protein
MASETTLQVTRINPYHYTLLSQRLNHLLQRITPSPKDIPLLDRVERSVFDRLASVLRLSYEGKNISSRYRLKEAFETATIYGSEGRVGTISEQHLFSRALSNGAIDIDWQSFADFYGTLRESDKQAVDDVLFSVTARVGSELLNCDHHYWTVPTKTKELQATQHVMGRDYVCLEEDKWLRADRYVARYQVFIDFEYADDNGLQTKTHCFGTAGTLQGAVEIAMASPAKLEIISDAQAAQVISESAIPARLKILETQKDWPEPKRLLNARLSSAYDTLISGDLRKHYSLSWIDPVPEANRPAVEALIEKEEEELNNSFRQGMLSHADVVLAEWEIDKIRATLPPEGYTAKQISDALIEAFQKLGSDEGIASLLERDLGL